MPEVAACQVGLLPLWLQPTSTLLTISENAYPAVCRDVEHFFNRLAPQGTLDYEHDGGGADDLPTHVKSSYLVSIEIAVVLVRFWPPYRVPGHKPPTLGGY